MLGRILNRRVILSVLLGLVAGLVLLTITVSAYTLYTQTTNGSGDVSVASGVDCNNDGDNNTCEVGSTSCQEGNTGWDCRCEPGYTYYCGAWRCDSYDPAKCSGGGGGGGGGATPDPGTPGCKVGTSVTKECGGRCADGQRQTLVCKTVNGVAKWVNQCARDTSCDTATTPETPPTTVTPPTSTPSGQCNTASPNNNKSCQSVGQNVDYGSGQCVCQLTPGTDACACVNVSGTVQAGGRCYKSSECALGDCSGNVCVDPTTAPAQVPPETAPMTIPCGNSFCSAAQKCVLEEVGIPVCLDSSVVAKNEEINKVVTKVTTLPKQTKDVTKALNALRGDTRFASPTYSTLSNINPGGSCPESAVDGTACSTQPGYTCQLVTKSDVEVRKICLGAGQGDMFDYCPAAGRGTQSSCADGLICTNFDVLSSVYLCLGANEGDTGFQTALNTVTEFGYCNGVGDVGKECGADVGVRNGVCKQSYVEDRGLFDYVCLSDPHLDIAILNGQDCYSEGSMCASGGGVCTRVYAGQSQYVGPYLKCVSSVVPEFTGEGTRDDRGYALVGQLCTDESSHDGHYNCGASIPGVVEYTGRCESARDANGDVLRGVDGRETRICEVAWGVSISNSVIDKQIGETCGISILDSKRNENHRCAGGAGFCLPDSVQPDLIKCQ